MKKSEERVTESSPALERMETFGVVGTRIWLVVLAGLAFFKDPHLLMLPLNEIGDFLAGAFAPLAFFWLIIGFYQQKHELKQNTNMLEQQKKEFENLVSATKQQSEAANAALLFDQEQAKNAARPFFMESKGVSVSDAYIDGKTVRLYWINVSNLGADVLDINFLVDKHEQVKLQNKQASVWKRDEDKGITFVFTNELEPLEFNLFILYRDSLGDKSQYVIKVNKEIKVRDNGELQVVIHLDRWPDKEAQPHIIGVPSTNQPAIGSGVSVK